ncbi:MAG: regulator [Bacteroidaceae bacterium]|nr:regulator [Bacteroidaceae bacterium]
MKKSNYHILLNHRRSFILRKMILFFIFSLFTLHATAQSIGSWQVYPAYTVCTYNIPVGTRIYAQMESKLMAYDTEDQSIQTFDWMKQLSDVAISFIRYSADAKRLIIVYDNGNIDLLSTEDDDDVINLAQLKNSTMQNKQVNGVEVFGHTAYICTGFGILCIDLNKAIVTHTYTLNMNVHSCTVKDSFLYAGTSSGIWRGLLTENLQDKAHWTQIHASLSPKTMTNFDEHVWAQVGSNLYVYDEGKSQFVSQLQFTPSYFSVTDGAMIVGNATQVYVFNKWNERQLYTGNFSWAHLTRKGNTFWASDNYNGLQAYQLTEEGLFQLKTAKIQPNSPLHDYSLHLKYEGDRLLVSGGNRNYTDTARPGTAMILQADGTWLNFDPLSAQTTCPNERYQDVTQIAQDPTDPNHHYVGTSRSGIFEFRDGKCVGHIGLENSPLQSILPNNAKPQNFVVADGLRYDNDGNLWTLNCTEGRADTTIRILQPNGRWTGIPCAEVKKANTLDVIFFDSKGRAWINSRRGDEHRGIFLLDYNQTINVRSDDYRQLRTTIINQDGTSYTPNQFYCIAEDLSGQIWIGTELGPFVITDPDQFNASNFTFEQVKVARNDGSGLADYLLSSVPILCITIDGAGRKWFGTEGSGVYLISEDGQEEIHHFTTENSPLIADEVFDIAINGKTGVVMFATSKGLCSYISDATDAEETLEKNNIYAFPNPVSPDYHGPITVRGLTKDGEVKIVSTAGQLVWSGTSNGGTFTWNGCNSLGQRVASGIYHVIANTSNGSEAIVTRIAFIR